MEHETTDRPRKIEGLETHVVEDQCVVYDARTDRLHYLNPTAALVLEFCDGDHSPAEISALVQQAYKLEGAPLDEVSQCLGLLKDAGLVT